MPVRLYARYHGQLPSCTISERPNDPILRNFSDGWTDKRTDRRTDRQTDENDFIGRCPTNVERPMSSKSFLILSTVKTRVE